MTSGCKDIGNRKVCGKNSIPLSLNTQILEKVLHIVSFVKKISLKPKKDPLLVRVLVIPKNPEIKDYSIRLICPYCR